MDPVPHQLVHPDVLAHLQGTIEDARHVHGELRDLIAAGQRPATIKTHRLTSAKTTLYDKASTEAGTLSIAVYNPTGISIFLGLNGGTASADAEAIPVPPATLIVLPVAVAQLEISAAAADLAAGDAVFFTLRYDVVQPAFLGGI